LSAVLLQDVRYALRSLLRSKGFAAVAILCLGFGIGVNTTIFSIVDGVLLKPFPYADPGHLFVVGVVDEHSDEDPTLSYLDLKDWREATTAFASLAGVQGRSLTVTDGVGEPARYIGAGITADMFPTLGVAPALGRDFTADEDSPAGGDAVLLSDGLWRSRYLGNPAVIGTRVVVNGVSRVVVGVMPPGFQFPTNQQLWIPLTPDVAKDPRNFRGLLVFGRVKPGVTIERATVDAQASAQRLAAAYPDSHKGVIGAVHTLRQLFIPSNVSQIIWMMMTGVTLVLFIACSNVANLLLTRATGRRRELAVRASMGAGRGRIVRQLITESVVLALLSVPLGLGLAEIGTRLIAAALPVDQVPYYIRWEIDGRSAAYTVAIAAATAVLFGLFPALQASRGNLHEALKEGSRGNSVSRSPLRSALVVTQIALALVALAGAMLFVRSFHELDTYQLGFDPKPLLTLRIYMPGTAYEEKDARARRVDDVLSRVESIPGVQAAFGSNMIPISGGGSGGRIEVEGHPVEPGKEPDIGLTGVTPHFYRTLGLNLRRGRDFSDAETAPGVRTPVAIINETMARRLWPDRDPIGSRFRRVQNPDGPRTVDDSGWFTVIGVAPDIKQDAINPGNSRVQPAAYVPYGYQQTLSTGFTIRTANRPVQIVSDVRAAIRASDPNLPIALVRTMEENRQLSFWEFALYGWIFGIIGVVGLILASIGVYGVMSYSVSQRTQEIGVRVALGASRRDVLRLVVKQGLVLAAIGVIAGLLLGPTGTYFGRTQLYNVSPFDPVSFGVVSAVLLLVALFASYVPALRATRVDPVIALRGE
jgi:putative ABC transport system permease protein